MEFLNQNKKSQRSLEVFVNIIYGIYTVNLCFAIVKKGGNVWMAGFMLAAFLISFSALLSKYRNNRIRAALTCVMMQIMFILYAVSVEDLSALIPTFMVLLLLVAFYGRAEFLWITWASLFFVVFYHGIITDNLWQLPSGTLDYIRHQVGNVMCMEIVLYIWLKHRNEANSQMYKIVEALMEAEQSKDDFLANISHEIRTPVNTICGMSEMALHEHELEKMREEIFDIRDAGHNLMSLVSDILDFSQLQQGKMNLEEEAYNITSTINDIINMAMARRGDKQIELIVDCAPDIPNVLFGDEKKIRRVIMNLVNNAIKYTSEGGVIIQIRVRRENYGVNLCISVKDTGIGIEASSLEKLFESFTQVDTRRNRQSGGVGLGLAISKELVHCMGGTITVRSRPGKGSVFSFVIPQKVLEDKPIGQVKDREKINIATYFDMEQFDMMAIRDEYTAIITNMVKGLQVRCHACRNLAELKRRESIEAFTHIFISLEEYQEDEAYFDELSGNTKIIIVTDRPREKYISNSNIVRLYKPFYILPVVSILNGSRGFEGGKQMVRPGKFTAPEAHILVVDDNRMNIRVVEGLLKEYKIKVTYATSGMEALDLIENMTYDFVFMDHMMPEMDGIETMHRIRDKVGHYYKRVPIIALTANAAPGSREMFLDEGFNDFVEKPIETSVLERVLKRNIPEEKLIFQTQEDKEAKTSVNGSIDDIEKKGKAAAEVMEKEEKITSDIETKEETSGSNGEDFAVGDLNVEMGMIYCGGKELYLDVLEACCEEAPEELEVLNGLFEKKDWKNYTIRVHAVKSGMKNIGAEILSEKAKALEQAGKKDDIDFIMENHEDLIKEYHRVIREIEQSILIKQQELSEEKFDEFMTELEDAMYALDGGRMTAIISEMQEYQYHQTELAPKLTPVRKKIEMSDYMSATEAVSRIREGLKNGK
ncbi:MAG: response regulator [Lachnospiraceae bacterium]|nr:response regulator [Lachnospiraceae bacterium]